MTRCAGLGAGPAQHFDQHFDQHFAQHFDHDEVCNGGGDCEVPHSFGLDGPGRGHDWVR